MSFRTGEVKNPDLFLCSMSYNIVEKSARKELRLAKLRPEDIVLVDTGTLAFVVAKHLLAALFPRHDIPFGKEGLFPLSQDERNAKFLTSYLEDISLDSVDFFLSSGPYVELERYAQKHKLKIVPPKLDEHEALALSLLQELQVDQTQTMSALHNSIENLRKVSGKSEDTQKKKLVHIKK